MTYDVTMHPAGHSAFVYRRESPRCLLTFSRTEAGAWTQRESTWFEEIPPEVSPEVIQAEAARAIVTQLGPGSVG